MGNPTKDQMRLMMQSLLADRFKLAIHTETKQGPVFALLLMKPGKTGPQLQPFADDGSCSATNPTPSTTPATQFPNTCGLAGCKQCAGAGANRRTRYDH